MENYTDLHLSKKLWNIKDTYKRAILKIYNNLLLNL